MADRQYQLDVETYVNVEDNGLEYQISVETYFNEEPAAAGGVDLIAPGFIHSFAVTRASNY